MPQLIAFVGPSGSGKTTLIEQLVPALRATGLTVGAIKNDAHGFQMDREGKDSDRLFQAGADGVLIQSPTELAYRRAHPGRQDPAALAERYFADCALVIVEGAKESPLPKIEVWQSAVHPAPLDPPPENRIACVVDSAAAAERVADVPAYQRDDVVGLRDLILARCS